ncbi:hypothetical protein [Actinokineospora sp. NBRC 105648]|uniref:hypothetical protein n=1 Tax=Actinokineospora sp. NBRC 105648 TaxID=3032206 RepID=UPI0024A43097|nr:hypothetical protein [Actinokineospora sp. NBRC 105648]GLZ40786.1 hypothetical protein Acsp05_44100 [Actinokineospora sp. NBRC 105648]
MWKPYQQLRLAQEQQSLRRLLPDFTFHSPQVDTYVSGWWTSNSDRRYQIRVNLPPGYPDAIPDTYVTYPSPLRGWDRPIEQWGNSHAMHTWQTDRPGWAKICIVRPEDWSAAFSVVKVLRKAMLWTTAYECHLDDGRPIKDFLL